jgi:hypothetical protein
MDSRPPPAYQRGGDATHRAYGLGALAGPGTREADQAIAKALNKAVKAGQKKASKSGPEQAAARRRDGRRAGPTELMAR